MLEKEFETSDLWAESCTDDVCGCLALGIEIFRSERAVLSKCLLHRCTIDGWIGGVTAGASSLAKDPVDLISVWS